MGCVNSTGNVRQAQDYSLDPVPNNQPIQASTARTASRRDIDPRLAPLSRPPRSSPNGGDGQYPLTIAKNASHPLRSKQQAAHELEVGRDGLVYQDGRRFSTGAWEESRYVMGANGRMYADRPVRDDGMFPDNHTSFLAGQQPAAAAGELIAHGGVIQLINDSSGHYAPTPKHTQQMLQELQARGVDTSSIHSPPRKTD